MSENNPKRASLIGSRVTSILSISLVLIVAGLCTILGLSIHRAARGVGDSTSILMTVVPGTDPLRVSEIKRTLNAAPWSASYEYTGANDVLVKERDLMDDETRHGLELLEENPFGDEFVITIADGWRSTDSLTAVAQRLSAMADIDTVTSNAEAMGNTNEGLTNVLLIIGSFGVILLVISIALIMSTVSLAIYSRRFLIYTMKLVGGKNSFIRRPFVRSAALSGAVSGVVAGVVVTAVTYYMSAHEPLFAPFLSLTDGLIIAGALILAGVLICRGAAWWATSRYLRRRYDLLFKK
ncbi:MAG: hypothetical protein K2K84_08790 [Muribaculaceae bacterium]|nr:hypothetical protein [Muribaculaceae bacterium]